MSHSRSRATSAIRSVPVRCPAWVMRTVPPQAATASAMRGSSVATITSSTPRASRTRS